MMKSDNANILQVDNLKEPIQQQAQNEENPLDNISQDSIDIQQIQQEKEITLLPHNSELDKLQQHIDEQKEIQYNQQSASKSNKLLAIEEDKIDLNEQIDIIVNQEQEQEINVNLNLNNNPGSSLKHNVSLSPIINVRKNNKNLNSESSKSFVKQIKQFFSKRTKLIDPQEQLSQFNHKYAVLQRLFNENKFEAVLKEINELNQIIHPINFKNSEIQFNNLLGNLLLMYDLAMKCHLSLQQYSQALEYAEIIIFLQDFNVCAHKVKLLCHIQLNQIDLASGTQKLIQDKFKNNFAVLKEFQEIKIPQEFKESKQIQIFKQFLTQNKSTLISFASITITFSILILLKRYNKLKKISQALQIITSSAKLLLKRFTLFK